MTTPPSSHTGADTAEIEAWVQALLARHASSLTRSELLKAIRALSARYVERRADLPRRSPVDSPGKRAAFATFFAPLHLVTARLVFRTLTPQSGAVRTVVDLGCGTGAAGAAWALACDTTPRLLGIDRQGWSLADAAWSWQHLGLHGTTRRGDVTESAARLAHDGPRLAGQGLVLGWTVNELDTPARDALLESLLACAAHGAHVAILEPISRAATPWWPTWAAAFRRHGGESRDWTLPATLPPTLSALSREAGFHREALTARSLWLAPARVQGTVIAPTGGELP